MINSESTPETESLWAGVEMLVGALRSFIPEMKVISRFNAF